MKFLLITLEFFPFKGGVANYYTNLIKHFPSGNKIEVVDNSKHKLMGARGLFSWFKSICLILAYKKRTKFDYLLVGQILPLGTAAYLASWFNSGKYGIILHGLDFNLAIKNKWKRIITRLILGKADSIICANSYVVTLVLKFYPAAADKLTVVNPGIEAVAPIVNAKRVKEIRKEYKLDDCFSLITIGRLVSRKGVDMVIKALGGNLQGREIKYFISGSGPEESRLRLLASTSPARENIFFLEELSDIDKWCWLSACDAFIMPARNINGDFEGFGIVYLEANLINKPVIAGNSGGVKDAVVHNKTGLLIDPENLNSIRKAIFKLADNSDMVKSMGKYGRNRAKLEFNWEKQAHALVSFIKDRF